MNPYILMVAFLFCGMLLGGLLLAAAGKALAPWITTHPNECVFGTCAIVFFVLVLFGL